MLLSLGANTVTSALLGINWPHLQGAVPSPTGFILQLCRNLRQPPHHASDPARARQQQTHPPQQADPLPKPTPAKRSRRKSPAQGKQQSRPAAALPAPSADLFQVSELADRARPKPDRPAEVLPAIAAALQASEEATPALSATARKLPAAVGIAPEQPQPSGGPLPGTRAGSDNTQVRRVAPHPQITDLSLKEDPCTIFGRRPGISRALSVTAILTSPWKHDGPLTSAQHCM